MIYDLHYYYIMHESLFKVTLHDTASLMADN